MAKHRAHRRRGLLAAAAAAAALIGLALFFAPVIFAEVYMLADRHHLILAPPPVGDFAARPGPPAGQAVGERWRVQALGADTWAIGEPQGDLDNYEYLIVGKTRALLIDAGSSRRDIRPVLAGLTRLPVTVLPTHLHYDHTSGLEHFRSIALIDLPQTRADVGRDGRIRLGRYQYMAAPDGRPAPAFRVSEWVKPDSEIDLGGGRKVKVIPTPGHTETSVSIYDPAARRLFTGDLIYTTTLYEFVPDASLSAFVRTADRLLADLPADTTLYGAHCCRNDLPAQAPWLTLADLRDARRAVQAIRGGSAHGRGFIFRRYPVNSRMTMLTLYPLGNR